MAFAERRERLWQAAAAEGVDALLVSHPVNVTYLTGFSGDSSYLLLDKRRALLVSDGRFTEQIAEECPDLEPVIRDTQTTLHEATARALARMAARSVGFESHHVTVADLETLQEQVPSATWKPGKDRVETLRVVKDAGEIAQIREAIRIAEKAFAMFRALLRPSDTEKELADALEMYVRRAGGKATSFPSIVAVGARSALPHAPPTARRLDDADLVLIDWGASGPFYKSDLTRVLWTPNNASPSADARRRQVFAAVRAAQDAAIAALRPGVAAKDVDAAARAALAKHGFADAFTHGLGHGIGLQIHEAPFMRPTTDTSLQAGMVVTVEPGVYLPGWGGIRIEDDVLVTPDGAEVLTSTPREYEECALEL